MQQVERKFYRKFYLGVLGFLWVAGLLAAGSEGEYMPWVNTLGLCVFFLVSVMLGKGLHEGASSGYESTCSKRAGKNRPHRETQIRANHRVRMRYA